MSALFGLLRALAKQQTWNSGRRPGGGLEALTAEAVNAGVGLCLC